DSLVGIVIQVDEVGFPVAVKAFSIQHKSMVLAGDITLVTANHPYRVVVSPVSVLKFVSRASGSDSHQLIAKADPKDRLITFQSLTYIVYTGFVKGWITRSV